MSNKRKLELEFKRTESKEKQRKENIFNISNTIHIEGKNKIICQQIADDIHEKVLEICRKVAEQKRMEFQLVHETKGPELSPEKKFLETLRKRFENNEKHYKNPEGIEWEEIQRALENSPEKLWSLNEMERTGGEPDLIEYNKKTDVFTFIDCSEESPLGRRNCVYDQEAEQFLSRNGRPEKWNGNAVSIAESMGVNLLSKSEYIKFQTKGKFDKKTWIWLRSPSNTRKVDKVYRANISCYHRDDGINIIDDSPNYHSPIISFRASLKVSKYGEKLEKEDSIDLSFEYEIKKTFRESEQNELSLQETIRILTVLKKRFENQEKHYKNPEGIKWEDIQIALKNSPKKLWSLNEMERTGGEPDLIEYNKKTGEYIFYDCSAESPISRRRCIYNNRSSASEHNSDAESMARLMGIEILDEKEYWKLQSKGVFDEETLNWLKTTKKEDIAEFSGRKKSKIYFQTCSTSNTDTDHISWGPLGGTSNRSPRERGFRGLLRISTIENKPKNIKKLT